MVVQKKNLLEAFRSAAQSQGSDAEPGGGPFVDLPPAPASLEEPIAARSRRALALEILGMPSWLPWVAAVGLAFVVGLALGRSGSDGPGDVEAAPARTASEPARQASPQPRLRRDDPAPGGASAPAAGANPLLDPANRFTVVVATYGASRDDYAWATHDHLRDNGFDVFPPLERGQNILVLVGAAPRVDELADTVAALQSLSGWDGGAESYATAYVERIDRLIDRTSQ